mgnify:CR=1 FL=1|tara:strand:+ start:298 stop:513 length:216 start_codon:yes stop_codon:yes gene_type:complete
MVAKTKKTAKKGWKLTTFNPLTHATLSTQNYNSIKEIANKHKNINEDTWRSISIGRSKVYEPFFKLEHINI